MLALKWGQLCTLSLGGLEWDGGTGKLTSEAAGTALLIVNGCSWGGDFETHWREHAGLAVGFLGGEVEAATYACWGPGVA